jgi:hypothetical protein
MIYGCRIVAETAYPVSGNRGLYIPPSFGKSIEMRLCHAHAQFKNNNHFAEK